MTATTCGRIRGHEREGARPTRVRHLVLASMKRASRRALLAVATMAAAAACSDVSSGTPAAGPAAEIREQITGTRPPFVGAAVPADGLGAAGYVEQEWVASGDAALYVATAPLGADGRWSFAEAGTEPYRTRVLVRRPVRAADASGTVLVEWLNVSGGIDANPDWSSLAEEIVRQGHSWVGVSAQLIGVEGGPVLVTAPGAQGLAGKGLRGIDPERYASLSHPGDGYAFDIYTQVARALRAGTPAMGGLPVERILAVGESQSAIALTTYYDGVQPLTRAFDGFFVHSRAKVGLPLVGPGEYADLASGFGAVPAILRTDLAEPVIDVQAEGDVTSILESVAVRQPDTGTFRLWEVAGTSHADAHLLGPIAGLADCGAEVNDGPLHLVTKAALRGLDDWIRTGTPPPSAPLLEVRPGGEAGRGEIVRDRDGIARGGVRTPPVDVPALVLSGEPGPNPDLFCILLGSTEPLPPGRASELYASREGYLRRYATSADATIAAGFVLPEDRAALLGYARPDEIGG